MRRNSAVLLLMLLCPIIVIAALNFCLVTKQSLTATQNELRINSERLLDLTERQFETVPKVTDSHKKDTGFFNSYQTDPLASYYYIEEGLEKDSLWSAFFSDVSYLNHKGKYIITTQGKDTMDFYFSKILPSKGLKEKSMSVYKTDSGQIQTFRVHNTLTNCDGVLFMAPLETADDNTVVSSMAFTVYDSTMSSMWDSVSKKGFMTLFYNSKPIYSSNPQINQAINKSESITGLLQNDSLTSSYSENAFTVQWNIPKFAFFTDILGVVVLQAVITFLVLAVTMLLLLRYTHKSYAPVRQILQRIPPQYLHDGPIDELKYIDMVVSDLTYSKKFLEQSNEELRREKYLYYILDNQVTSGSALYQQCLDAGIHVDRRWFACILLDDTEENEELFQELNEKSDNEDKECNLYSMYIMDNKYMYLLCSDEEYSQLEQRLQQIGSENEETVSVSRIVDDVARVRSVYMDVCQSKEKQVEQSPDVAAYPELEIETLQEAVSVENADKVEFSLRMIKNKLAACSEMWRASIFVTVCSILNQGDRRTVSRQVQAMHATDTETICTAIDALFSNYLHVLGTPQEEGPAPRGHRSLGSVMQYLEEHYQDSNFTIKSMAIDFHTSSSNLSHFFKKSTGQTLSHFIDEMKVKRAEELLLSGEKVNDVAQQLGYNSASVFIETFKRMRGVTPSVFRCNCEEKALTRNSKN